MQLESCIRVPLVDVQSVFMFALNKEVLRHSSDCFKITRLIEGTEYEFRVAAFNSAGTGPFSSPSDSAFAVDPLSELE